jgi:hypothetical protein
MVREEGRGDGNLPVPYWLKDVSVTFIHICKSQSTDLADLVPRNKTIVLFPGGEE